MTREEYEAQKHLEHLAKQPRRAHKKEIELRSPSGTGLVAFLGVIAGLALNAFFIYLAYKIITN